VQQDVYIPAMEAISLDPKDYTKLYLNGQFTASISKQTYSLRNPKNNSVIAETVPIAGPEDIEAAVKYAEAAFTGPWSRFTAMQRTDCLLKLASLLEDALIPILTLD
jgi:aldehyde dehydrogenase (NAD+)/retinal dehydrogenase